MAVTDTNNLTSTSTLKLNMYDMTPLKNCSTQILNWITYEWQVGIKEEVNRNIFTDEKEHFCRSTLPNWCININIHAFQRLLLHKIDFNIDILLIFPSESSLQRDVDNMGFYLSTWLVWPLSHSPRRSLLLGLVLNVLSCYASKTYFFTLLPLI